MTLHILSNELIWTAPLRSGTAWATSFPDSTWMGIAGLFGLLAGLALSLVASTLPVMLERAWQADLESAVSASRGDNAAEPVRADSERLFSIRAALNPFGVLAAMLSAIAALAVFGVSMSAGAAFLLCTVLIALSIIDFRHHLLPDAMTLPLLWAGLVINLGSVFATLQDAVLGAIFGYLSLWATYWLFRLLRGIEGMGYGDFKLLAALGAWLGWQAVPQVVVLAAAGALVFGLARAAIGRQGLADPLPFGPCLAFGGVVSLFAGTVSLWPTIEGAAKF